MYIPPVTQYEYIQYANRTIESEREKVNIVDGTTRIFPLKFYNELKERDQHQLTKENKRDFSYSNGAHSYKNIETAEIIEQTASELTGKGYYVNERI